MDGNEGSGAGPPITKRPRTACENNKDGGGGGEESDLYLPFYKPNYQRLYPENSTNAEFRVFVQSNNNERLGNKSPIYLNHIFATDIKGVVAIHRVNATKIAVVFKQHNTANNFLANTTFLAKHNMKAFIPAAQIEKTGIIRFVPTNISNKDLYTKLSSVYDIIAIRRFTKKVGQERVPLQTILGSNVVFCVFTMPRRFWGVRRLLRMPLAEAGEQYSIWVGLIYVFNLIVGTGALTLPAAFARAGWALSTICLVFLAFMSFMNATYVIETMACANAVLKWKRLQSIKRDSIQDGDSEEEASGSSSQRTLGELEEPLVCGSSIPSRYYSLDRRVELGEMANMFLNRTGRTMFYVLICVYLYGDLSIYSAAVAKSIMDVVCTPIPPNAIDPAEWDELPCFNSTTAETTYTRVMFYRVSLLSFVGAVGPFIFFNVQKTKYLQLFTSGMRWLAFTIMISIAIHLLLGRGAMGSPPAFDVTGLPTLFGACVYSFMCHHSLPGLISPIRGKDHLGLHLSLDYALITVFYLLLAFTGAFAFAHLSDLYTLNFVPSNNENIFLKIIEYFLALFPVFTLSTSFPIIGITLRNNLQSLFLDTSRIESYNFVLRRLLFPVITVAPPLLLTYYLEDIGILIEFTGSYAGTGIQYLIPTFLVISARRHCNNLLGLGVVNKYKSPFSHTAWATFVLLWSMMCVILVSVNISEKKS